MAIRFPLYYDRSNGSLKNITEAERAEIVSAAIYEYGVDPSVTLSRVSSGGNLGTLVDNRYKASAVTTIDGNEVSGHQDYDGSGSDDYAEPGSIVNVATNNAHISQTVASLSSPSRARPLYYDSGNIKHMSQADFQDTFIKPAIALLVDGNDRAGTYKIHTSSSQSGHSAVSGSAVFADTSADISAYTNAGIAETRDQPENVQLYYLLLKTNDSNPTNKSLMMAYANGDIKEFAPAHFRSLLRDEMRYAATALTDYKIRYGYDDTGSEFSFSGGSQQKGSSMTDKRHNSETVGDRRISADDEYKTQRFPAGSLVTVNTYTFKIRRE